jgi:hypothetical protein
VPEEPFGDAADRLLAVAHRWLVGGEHCDRQAAAVALQRRDPVDDAGAPAALEADAEAVALGGRGDAPALPAP